MTAEALSSGLTSVASAFANHIWQSTVFAAVVGLLTLLLRKHQARIRFSLWLAASIKFLVPFSLLIALGGLLPKSQRVVSGSQAGLYSAIDVAGQPFSVGGALPIGSAVHAESLLQRLSAQLPLVLLISAGVWLVGALVVLLVWVARWRQVSAILRRASPIEHGHEMLLLRRLEEAAGRRGRMALRLSPERMEPGVFGVFRPVLIWPERLSERLDEEQMAAILAHEMTHERRRDNLAAAIHMLVEVLFWFHPMVWWMGRRMMEERERACDEAVVRLGSSPEAYAEGLLKACRFCVETPLACVSGITGADLSRRVRAIMMLRLGRQLGFKEKVMFVLAAAVVIGGPVTFGVMKAAEGQSVQQARSTTVNVPSEVFDVATIKPIKPTGGHFMFGGGWSADGFTSFSITLRGLVKEAYGIQDNQISGGPSWIDSERFDVQAKMGTSTVDDLQKLSPDQRELVQEHMLQALLADRFHLVVRHETKELPVYALAIAKNGPKLTAADPANTYANGFKAADGGPAGSSEMEFGGGELTGQGVPILVLVSELSQQPELAGRTIIDRTGLAGRYDFTLKWTLQRAISNSAFGPDNGPAPDSSEAALFTALREQLGLRVESTKGPVDTIVIDHIEKPSEN